MAFVYYQEQPWHFDWRSSQRTSGTSYEVQNTVFPCPATKYMHDLLRVTIIPVHNSRSSCGKVMFSQASVILSMGGGRVYGEGGMRGKGGMCQHRIQWPGGGGARNMKSMWPPLAAIFFMTYLYRAGRGHGPPRHPPGSATVCRGRRCAWQGTCIAEGMHDGRGMAGGGACGEGGRGGVRGWRCCRSMMSLPVWLPGPMFLWEGGYLPGPMFFLGGSPSKGVSVQWGTLSGGGSVWEGLSGRPPRTDPPYGEERAVCILLECFLVILFTFTN